jgi:hypothetical protein
MFRERKSSNIFETQGLNYGFYSQSQAKFSLERAKEVVSWVEAVLERKLEISGNDDGIRDQLDFASILRDGVVLCE